MKSSPSVGNKINSKRTIIHVRINKLIHRMFYDNCATMILNGRLIDIANTLQIYEFTSPLIILRVSQNSSNCPSFVALLSTKWLKWHEFARTLQKPFCSLRGIFFYRRFLFFFQKFNDEIGLFRDRLFNLFAISIICARRRNISCFSFFPVICSR